MRPGFPKCQQLVLFGMAAGLMVLLVLAAGCRKEPAPQPEEVPTRRAYLGSVPPGALARLGKGEVNTVTFSPDGTIIAAGGNTGLYAYETATFHEPWQLPVTSPLLALAFSPNGKILAAGAEDGTTLLVDSTTGQVLNTLSSSAIEEVSVQSLAWTDGFGAQGGLLLAVGFNDGAVVTSRMPLPGDVAASAESIELLGNLEHQQSGVTAMAFSPNGKILATGNRSGIINLWEAESSAWVGALQGHEPDNAVLSLMWAPAGDRLVSGGKDDRVILWDLLTFSSISVMTGHHDDAINVSYGPDGKAFTSTSSDGVLLLREVEDTTREQAVAPRQAALRAVAWSADWTHTATIAYSGLITLWEFSADSATLSASDALLGHSAASEAVGDLAWSPDSSRIAAGLGNNLLIWDAADFQLIQTLEEHSAPILAVAWSPDGKRLASGGRDKTVVIWDAETGKELLTLTEHTNIVTDVDWSPDGSLLAAAGSLDDSIIIWDGQSGEVQQTLTGNGSGIWSLAWSPDGERLATGTTPGEIMLWDMNQREPEVPFLTVRRHLDWITGLSWSPDGTLLASSGADTRVVLSDFEAEKAETFAGHLNVVRGVAFSPDGNQIASAGHDNLVIIWAAGFDGSSEPLRILSGHAAKVNSVSWSPDGSRLASGSNDGTIILWPTDGDS